MIVGPASEGDFDEWFALLEAVAAEGRWIATEAPVDREERREVFTSALREASAELFVARIEQRLVGALGAEENHGIVTFGMMVATETRRAGIGTALLEACIGWARGRGSHKVGLQVWPHNQAAIGLYERSGFAVEGRLRRHYRRRNGELWDAIVMGLVLDHTSPGRGDDEAPG